jgi:glycosyltransferase involved in cell wall biosynthesis
VFEGYFGPMTSSFVRWVERAMALLTDCVVTVSARQKSEICNRFRIVPARKTEVVELGLELKELAGLGKEDRLRRELRIAPDAIVFGYVGRFVPIKDLPTLLHAFARVARQLDSTQLILFGDGEVRSELVATVARLQLGDRVTFAGWQQDLAAVYGSIDIAVLSSRNEGTPVAIIEAMAAAKPVIATAVGGVEDVITDGCTGLIVRCGDVDQLAAAMLRLATSPPERVALGHNARAEVVPRFSPDRLISDVTRLYWRVLAEQRGLSHDGRPSPRAQVTTW